MTVTDTGRRSLDDLLGQARQLVGDGPVPSKEKLRQQLQVHWKRAEAVHERLTAERAQESAARRRDGRARMSKLRSRRNARPVVVRPPVFRTSTPELVSAVPVSPAPEVPAVVSVDGEKTSAWLPATSTEPLPIVPADPVDIPLDEPPSVEVQKTSGPVPRVVVWPLLVIACSPFIAIWGGWVGLGKLTGFGDVNLLPGIVKDGDWATLDTAITLPLGMEAYSAYAFYVLLHPAVSARARRFAVWTAFGAVLLGMAGQTAYHLMIAVGMTAAPWQITTVVSCLPVAVFGLAAALVHLVRAGDADS